MSVLVNHATVFYNFVTIDGWCLSPGNPLVAVTLVGENACTLKVTIEPENRRPDGSTDWQYRFRLHGYLHECPVPAAQVIFETQNGLKILRTINELVFARYSVMGADALYRRFLAAAAEKPGAHLLDVGGRARSGVDRSLAFPNSKCVVFDVNEGDNVDVVGDAHQLSSYTFEEKFDFVQSVSVFEHLAQPWVVVAEINKVMKPGGLLFISSHQTIGMHDVPWDFWRFSDRAYHSMLNASTGFEVLSAELHEPTFIVPHLYIHNQHFGGEAAAGFISAAVLARKISDVSDTTRSSAALVLDTPYPG